MKQSLICILSLAILSLAQTGSAATFYWDGGASNITTNGDGISQGGAGTWDTTLQNWDQGDGLAHIAWNNGQNNDAYLAGLTNTVALGAAITANSVTFNTASGYVVSDGGNAANTLTLNAATNISGASIGANVVNSATFSTYGGGTLSLTNACSGLTGKLAVNGGTLQLGATVTGLNGPTSFGDVTIASNATFRINQGATSTYNQNISGAGSLFVGGNSYSSTVSLSGANDFTGNVTLNQVNVSAYEISDTAPSALGTGTNVYFGTGNSTTYLTYGGYGTTTTRTLTLGGGGAAAKLLQANGYAPLVWLGPVAFANGNRHTLSLGGTSLYLNVFGGTIPDNIVSNTAVAKSGAGTWLLAGTNTYSGGTTFANSSGSLLISNDFALGVSTGAVIFAGSGSLKSISNNVTLSASRTVTVSNTYTASLGVYDANNFNVAAYITGPGAVTKASSSYALGWTRFSNDTNNFAGDFTAGYGNTEFTSLADQGAPSSLGVGAVATGGRINIINGSSAGTLRYVGAANSATHRPLYWTNSTASFALDSTNTGTIAYLSSAQLIFSAGTRTLTLQGSNTGTNTLAQVINDNGGTTSLAKSGTGKWVLSGANTYTGPTTISGGTLSVSSDANLGTPPAGATPNSLTINNGSLAVSSSFALNANRGIALGPTGTNVISVGRIDVASGLTLTYGGIMANSTTTNVGILNKTSAGSLVLSGANTYSGDTRITAGTLALSGAGSLASSTNISIFAGATLDVAGVSGGYTLVSGQVLQATNGATATINGTLNVASAALVMTNVPNTPTITVTGGALTLSSGMSFTVNVNNGGNGLSGGTYKLIAKGAGGSVGGTAPAAVTVGGDGLALSATAELSLSSGELFLVVSGGALTPPVVDSFGMTGSGIVLSFNGPSGQTWKILTSTNVAKALANWDVTASGTFAGTPVSYTNASPVDPRRFYRITSP
jgi:fibronectin-binding autotransporter adhesin